MLLTYLSYFLLHFTQRIVSVNIYFYLFILFKVPQARLCGLLETRLLPRLWLRRLAFQPCHGAGEVGHRLCAQRLFSVRKQTYFQSISLLFVCISWHVRTTYWFEQCPLDVFVADGQCFKSDSWDIRKSSVLSMLSVCLTQALQWNGRRATKRRKSSTFLMTFMSLAASMM